MNFDKKEAQAVSHLRLPPQSNEAECSVLGGLLLSNESFDHVVDLLSPADFYKHEHKLIYSSVHTLLNQSHPADVITVHEHLKKQGKSDEVGGLAYLNSLAQYVPSAANIRGYAQIVRDQSILRNLVTAGEDIATAAFDTQGRAVKDVLESAERTVLAVGEQGFASSETISLDERVMKFLDTLQERADNPEKLAGTSTSFSSLDGQTNGLKPGDLVVIAGRPSMGKTTLAMNVAAHVAIDLDLPVLVFSLEMTAESLVQRCVGSRGRVDQSRLEKGKLTDDEWPRALDAADAMKGRVLDIHYGVSTVSAMRSVARRAARRYKRVGLVVVDYLQLMTGSNDENRATEIAGISRGLKLLAAELQCPVIALSQLNRSVESRNDKRPMMSDLRESGAIEQDADVIMLIYRDDYYNKESKEPGIAEVNIAKQRNGPTGTVRLAWRPEYTRFDDLAGST